MINIYIIDIIIMRKYVKGGNHEKDIINNNFIFSMF